MLSSSNKQKACNELYLCSISLVTPLGADPTMLKAAMDAGINRFCDYPLSPDGDDTVVFSPVPDTVFNALRSRFFPGMSQPQIRMFKLAQFALLDLLPQLPAQPLPLFMAGPTPYYPESGIGKLFMRQLLDCTGAMIDSAASRYIATGRTGVIDAIDLAFRYFEVTGADYALVAGLDSYLDMRTLGILDSQQRLMGGDSGDGFVPSEAAGFLLLASPRALDTLSLTPLARSHRPVTAYGDRPLPTHSSLLVQVVQQALEQVRVPVDYIYSSENGELQFVPEFSLTLLRHQHSFRQGFRLCRPAEFLGDTGAAFAAVAIAAASVDLRKKITDATLIAAASDSGYRAAVCLTPV